MSGEKPRVHIRVHTREGGTFVYNGTRGDGSARWSYFKPSENGELKPAPVPARLRRILRKEKNKHVEHEAPRDH